VDAKPPTRHTPRMLARRLGGARFFAALRMTRWL